MYNSKKKQVKDFLKKCRELLIGNNWKYSIKPIVWYNFHTWIWHTISEDFKRYQKKKYPWSWHRLTKTFLPNLSQPIFIVGAPRSGTTFLGNCIGEIPEISYHFEPVLTKAASRYIYMDLWNDKFAANFFRSVYSWLMRIHFNGDLRFAEKTPQVSLVIPFLYQTFPDAKFVHIIRDGRDSAISLSLKLWYQNKMKGSGSKEPGGYPLGPKARFWVESERIQEFETTNDLHRCIWLWRRYLEIILESSKNLSSDTYMELRYEDLVNHPNQEATKILNFINIEKAESRNRFIDCVTNRVNDKSIGRWQIDLSKEQKLEIEKESGHILKKLKYI